MSRYRLTLDERAPIAYDFDDTNEDGEEQITHLDGFDGGWYVSRDVLIPALDRWESGTIDEQVPVRPEHARGYDFPDDENTPSVWVAVVEGNRIEITEVAADTIDDTDTEWWFRLADLPITATIEEL